MNSATRNWQTPCAISSAESLGSEVKEIAQDSERLLVGRCSAAAGVMKWFLEQRFQFRFPRSPGSLTNIYA